MFPFNPLKVKLLAGDLRAAVGRGGGVQMGSRQVLDGFFMYLSRAPASRCPLQIRAWKPSEVSDCGPSGGGFLNMSFDSALRRT